MAGFKNDDEAGRLLALRRYGVLDTPREDDFDQITAIVREVLGVPICGISLIDRDRQWFKSLDGHDAVQTTRGSAFCDHTIRTPGPMVVEDARDDVRFADNPLVTGDPNIRSYAGVPLRTPDGYHLGALCAVDRSPRQFSDSELALLERFSELVMAQLELRTMAHVDHLTRAMTRRAFRGAAAVAVKAAEWGSMAALVTFDLDHFKRVNDFFGHPVGDQLLEAVAATCRSMLRPSDSLGRLGGEEFGVLLRRVGTGEAEECAERLRGAIEALVIDNMPRTTASFGVAALELGMSIDAWFAAADAALYRAKKLGRNRSVTATSMPSLAAA